MCVYVRRNERRQDLWDKYLKAECSGQLLSVGISTSPEYFEPDLLDLGILNIV